MIHDILLMNLKTCLLCSIHLIGFISGERVFDVKDVQRGGEDDIKLKHNLSESATGLAVVMPKQERQNVLQNLQIDPDVLLSKNKNVTDHKEESKTLQNDGYKKKKKKPREFSEDYEEKVQKEMERDITSKDEKNKDKEDSSIRKRVLHKLRVNTEVLARNKSSEEELRQGVLSKLEDNPDDPDNKSLETVNEKEEVLESIDNSNSTTLPRSELRNSTLREESEMNNDTETTSLLPEGKKGDDYTENEEKMKSLQKKLQKKLHKLGEEEEDNHERDKGDTDEKATIDEKKSHDKEDKRATINEKKSYDKEDSVETNENDEEKLFKKEPREKYEEESSLTSAFLKIFNHDIAGGFFSSPEEALRKHSNNSAALLFSVLDEIDQYKNEDGNYHLKLCYPELTGVGGGHCNEWTQTSNPVTDTTITGFQPITIAFTQNGYGEDWRGLGRSPDKYPATLMDDAPSRPFWWTAIGATKDYAAAKLGIPGPFEQKKYVNKIELYIKPGR